ncbi:MAG: DUF4835 family protein [Melioribacteraceae bacterium]
MKKLIIICLLLLSYVQFAQELNATVTVNFEQLKAGYKDRLENFAQEVEGYLNNNKFSNIDWEGEPINCSFNIFFTSAAGESSYNAQVVIVSQRPIYKSEKKSLMLKVSDSNWKFKYEKNEAFYFNESEFNPLFSFLDYYAYLIIGLDLDSYPPLLGGTGPLTKAANLAAIGASSGYSKGWAIQTSSYNKRSIVDDLLSTKFLQFRKDLFDYHYNGLDIYDEDKKSANLSFMKLVNNLSKTIDKVGRMNVLTRVFFDTKHKELAAYLKDNPDKTALRILRKIDPSHTSSYEQGLEE